MDAALLLGNVYKCFMPAREFFNNWSDLTVSISVRKKKPLHRICYIARSQVTCLPRIAHF